MAPEAPIPPDLHPRVLDRLGSRFGLRFAPSRTAASRAAVRQAYQRWGGRGPADFLARLGQGSRNDPLVAFLLLELTVGETHFWRHPAQLELVARVVFPDLHARGRRSPLAWSAGCASGEEAYTLALLFADSPLFAGANPNVVGTDLVEERLERARAARYPERALRGLAPRLRAGYFLPAEGSWRLRREALPPTRFQFEDLLLGPAALAPGSVDLALCRNVLIYYPDPRDQAHIVGRLAASLAPGGWLILGHAERLPEGVPLERLSRDGVVAYRRPHAADPTRPAPLRPAALRPQPAPPSPRSSSLPMSQAPDTLTCAIAAADAGRLQEAATLARGVLARDPRATRARLLLALVAERRGEPDRARTCLEEGLYLDPAHPGLLLYAADFFERLGQPERAARHRRAAAACGGDER